MTRPFDESRGQSNIIRQVALLLNCILIHYNSDIVIVSQKLYILRYNSNTVILSESYTVLWYWRTFRIVLHSAAMFLMSLFSSPSPSNMDKQPIVENFQRFYPSEFYR